VSWKRRSPASPTKDRETYAYYLGDLGYLIREAGEQTKEEVASVEGEDKVFQQGRRMAYIEVLSLMQQQAEAFGIPLSEVCLDGIDPDNDLW
jgi:hypothetical protein